MELKLALVVSLCKRLFAMGGGICLDPLGWVRYRLKEKKTHHAIKTSVLARWPDL